MKVAGSCHGSCGGCKYAGRETSAAAIRHHAERVEGVRFIEQGREVDPREKKKRAQMLARALRKLGYEVTITPINQVAPTAAV